MLGSAVIKVEPIVPIQTVNNAIENNRIVRIDRLKCSNIMIHPGLNVSKTKFRVYNARLIWLKGL